MVERDPLGQRLLGAHVRRRADQVTGQRHRWTRVVEIRESKVDDLQHAVRIEQQIARLDVTVHDAFLVRRLQCICDSGKHFCDPLEPLLARSVVTVALHFACM